MSSTLQEGLLFLIDTVFNLYLFILAIRLILAFVRADYFNPVTQFTLKLTDFALKPFKRLIPNISTIETRTLLLIFLIELIKFTLMLWLSNGGFNSTAVFILSIADMLNLFIQTFTYAIILQAILSLVQPASPFTPILYRVTAPILRPIQRILPQAGGFDLSPIPALIILQLLRIVIVHPMLAYGQTLMILN